MGWLKCWSFKDQSLLPRDFSNPLSVSVNQSGSVNQNGRFDHTTLCDLQLTTSLLHWTRGQEWNSPKKSCYGELGPLSGTTYPAGPPPAYAVVNKVLSTIKNPVYLLDITTLSQLRKDAHPSTYSGDHSGNDCSHWCLPGLPDTWNQLLYAALIMWRSTILSNSSNYFSFLSFYTLLA